MTCKRTDSFQSARKLRTNGGTGRGSAGRASILAAIVSSSGSWLGPSGPTLTAPPFYLCILALVALVMLVAGARAWMEQAVGRRLRATLEEQRRNVAQHLMEFHRAVVEPGGMSRAIAGFSSTLAHTVGFSEAVLYLRPDAAQGAGVDTPDPASAPWRLARETDSALVSEEGGDYAIVPSWLPLAVDETELGGVVLGTAPQEDGALDSDLALATLLCGHLALGLRNADYRTRVATQRDEIERLRRQMESSSTAVLDEIRHPERFPEFIGSSAALRAALALVERVAPSEVSVLVTGETGTGKELVARAVHALSGRQVGPLVTVNCPAIPGPLAESELFGHERGAFTDAIAARPGQFELAEGGTIFLDEVADLPRDIQAKLLRVLQEREMRRVGGHRARPINVRTIAATNRDLLAMVREGRFREDLYYRLAAVEIALPPLRVRHGDVSILASFFLAQAAHNYGKDVTGFTTEAMASLCGHHWPGNVRQLQNAVHRAVLLCPSGNVRMAHLAEIAEAGDDRAPNFGDAMRQEKRRRFLEALHQSGGNQSAAARLLGMSRSNFARMLRSLEIAVPARGRRANVHQYPSSTKLT